MDDLKFKVINFVKKQGPVADSIENEEVCDEEIIRNLAIIRSKTNDENENSVEDEQILLDLPSFYYNASSDFEHFILKGLPKGIDCIQIKSQLRILYRQHNVVSKKTLRLILEKESVCKEELNRIANLQTELGDALMVCRNSRSQLSAAKQSFTTNSLAILKLHKRKEITGQIVAVLNSIRTLFRSDVRIQQLLETGDFPGAIHLLLECQRVASSMKHFKCVAQLNSKLQDTLESTETQLDLALSKICKHFDEPTYTKLQEAYSLLDKSHTVMDQLLMHFTSEVHSSAFQVVHKFAPSANSKQFQQICKLVPSTSLVPCLQALCKESWYILNSYNEVVQWHQRKDQSELKMELPGRDIERSLNKQYAKQKLENGQLRLWNDIQARIVSYIISHNLSGCKFEDLIHVLGILHRLMEIGESFCGSKCDELSKCIRQQTISYFQNYHASKLEELRIFLENEAWTPCPVRPQFNLLYLQEFKCLRGTIENHRRTKKNTENDTTMSNFSTTGSSTHTDFFQRYSETLETPFDACLDETLDDEMLNNLGENLSGYYSISSEDSDNDELNKASLEDNDDHGPANTRKRNTNPLLVSNTSLTVLRHCGKYLQMCRLLKPIAFDVILCMCQLFDYYLYNVYHFFSSDLTVQSATMVSIKLQTSLKRIEENLIEKLNADQSQSSKGKIIGSCISETVNLTTRDNLYGLSERVVAVESLIFLGAQFEYIRPFITHLIPVEKRYFLEQFFSQTVSCVKDVRRVAYMCVSSHVVDMQAVLKEMSKVNFDVKDVLSQHSPYIDKIVREIQIFSMKLDELEIDIPLEAVNVIWENVVHVVNNLLVEGFSGARKCSPGGRALMQLDYTQLISKVEKVTLLKVIPNKDYVYSYIKAFYLEESKWEDWISQHKEYTPKQMESLIHCACQISKKTKQRLLQLI